MRAVRSFTAPTTARLTVAAVTTAHRADPSDPRERHLKAAQLLAELDEIQTSIRSSDRGGNRPGEAEGQDVTGPDLIPTENAILREIYRRQELLKVGIGWTTVTNQASRIADGAPAVAATDRLDDGRLDVGESLSPNDAA